MLTWEKIPGSPWVHMFTFQSREAWKWGKGCNISKTLPLFSLLTNIFHHCFPLPSNVCIPRPHFKAIFQQRFKTQVPSNNKACDGRTESLLSVIFLTLWPETDIILGDRITSFRLVVMWGIPVQSYGRCVSVNSCCKVLNWVWSQSCRD